MNKRKSPNLFRFLSLILIFIVNTSYSQTKAKPYTKLFFEYGFENCMVMIFDNNKSIYKGVLTSVSKSGATEIVSINKPTTSIIIKTCGKTKKLFIRKGKFYAISILENRLVVEELDEEPFYV